VDRDGKSVAFDFPDRADLCELLSALIADEKIQTQGSGMNVNEDFIENIDCPGSKERGSPRSARSADRVPACSKP